MTAEEETHSMSFWDHLEELRKRLLYALIAFVVATALAWAFKERVLGFITLPYVEAWNAGNLKGSPALHFPAPASLFMAYMHISLLAGAVLSLPVILYQAWAFIAPGLYANEKRYAVPFVVASCGLFAGGAYFGLRLAFPLAFQFFLGMAGEIQGGIELRPTVMVSDYIDFVSYLLLAFGVTFELPVVIFFLSAAGIVTYRDLLHFWRYFVVLAFVLGAVLTPPDVMSQLLLALPLCVLYGISIIIAWFVGRRPTPEPPPEDNAGPV